MSENIIFSPYENNTGRILQMMTIIDMSTMPVDDSNITWFVVTNSGPIVPNTITTKIILSYTHVMKFFSKTDPLKYLFVWPTM